MSFEEFLGEENHIEKIFKTMDKDNDGFISKQVSKWLREGLKKYKEMNGIFHSMTFDPPPFLFFLNLPLNIYMYSGTLTYIYIGYVISFVLYYIIYDIACLFIVVIGSLLITQPLSLIPISAVEVTKIEIISRIN